MESDLQKAFNWFAVVWKKNDGIERNFFEFYPALQASIWALFWFYKNVFKMINSFTYHIFRRAQFALLLTHNQGRKDRFMPFSMALIQTAYFSISTHLVEFISDYDNHYAAHTYIDIYGSK